MASDSGTDEYFEIMALRQQYYRRMRGMSDIDDTVVQGPAALDRTEAQHNRIIRGILAWMFVAIVVVAWAWYCLVGSETPQDRHWVQPRNEVGR
jgi:type VI protein secretion system component VasF